MSYTVHIQKNHHVRTQIKANTDKVALAIAKEVEREAKRIVPVDTGRLRRSSIITGKDKTRYVRFRTPYAAFVHRNVRPWLTQAVQNVRGRVGIIAATIYRRNLR